MNELSYLRARLPSLESGALTLPITATQFLELIHTPRLRKLCQLVLDWLGTANGLCLKTRMPQPFDQSPVTLITGDEAQSWLNYYQRLTASDVPEIISDWAKIDAAVISWRQAQNQRLTLLSVYDRWLPTELKSLLESEQSDQTILTWLFSKMNFKLNGDWSADHLYAYTIKLMLLIRLGRSASQQ